MPNPLDKMSVRARLTLWSMGVLALTLIGCASIVHFTVQASLMRSIDQDLAREAQAAFLIENRGPHNIRAMGYITAAAPRPFDGAPWPDPPPDPSHAANSDPKRIGPEMPPVVRIRHLLPGDGSANAVFQAVAFQQNPETSFSERHRFISVCLRDSQGKILPPFPEGDALGRSVWNQQLALAGDRERYTTLVSDHQTWRMLTVPHKIDGRIAGVAQVSYPLQEVASLLRGLDRTLFILFPLALLVVGIGGASLTNRALRPVRQITRAAMEVEANDLSRRLPVTGGDEFAQLAITFNGMFERLQVAFSRLEESVRQQRRFTADASHELRTPLTTVRANADWALRKRRHVAEYQEALRSIVQAVDRTDQLIESLLCLARADSGHPLLEQRPLSLSEVLQTVVLTAPRADTAARIHLDLPDSTLGTIGSAEQLERVFLNLLQNAMRHTPADGAIWLSVHEKGECAVVTVEDTGEGIPPEHLPYVCERFYRVDAARSRPEGGAGLGLAICQSIVQAHGGMMQIESAAGIGTRVSVVLPLLRKPTSSSGETPIPYTLVE